MKQAQYRRGADAAKEATKGGQFAKTNFFSMDDGEQAYIRLLSDADSWIVVEQHQMIPTKAKPDGFEGNWPERMGSVCRRDEAFKAIFSDCYICEFMVDGEKIKKPAARTWALACLREEVIGDGSEELGGPEMKGKQLGIRDKTREVTKTDAEGKPTNETYIEKAIVVLNMGYKNFFAILQGFAGHYGTLLNRDWLVKRSGGGTETTYSIIPMDPILVDDAGTQFDLRNSDHLKRYGHENLDAVYEALGEIVFERASDEFYARFFDPRFTPQKGGGVSATGATPAEVPKPSGDVDQERMKQLAQRVKGYKDGDAQDAQEAQPASEQPAAPDAASKAPAGLRNFG